MSTGKYLLLYFVIGALSIVLYLLNLLGVFSSMYSALHNAVRPINLVFSQVYTGLRDRAYSFLELSRLKQENITLSEEILSLKEKLFDAKEKLKRCKEPLPKGPKSNAEAFKVYRLEVVDRLGDKRGVIVTICPPQVFPGDIVTYKGFFIGTVAQKHGSLCKIDTIWASDFKKYAFLEKAKLSGILVRKTDGLYFDEVLISNKVKGGDRAFVVDPKLGIKLYVGEVVKVKDPLTGAKKIIKIKPYVDIDRLNFVYVLKP